VWLLLGTLACNTPAGNDTSSSSSSDEIGTSEASESSTSESSTSESSTSESSTSDTTSTESETGMMEPFPGTPPEQWCPGGPSTLCDPVPGAPLEAGVAVLSIVPNCFESRTDVANNGTFDDEDDFLDCGCDRLCPGDVGYAAPDEGEGDGEFQRIFIGGFQNNRPAAGVRGAGQGLVGEGDGLWARALVLQQGNTRVAIVTIDVVGYFYDEVEAIRELLVNQNVDWLLVHAIHNHQGPDTMGLWGEGQFSGGGFDPDYRAQLRLAISSAVTQAIANRREVGTIRVGRGDASTTSAEQGILNVNNDLRDPFIVDEAVDVLQLSDLRGETIASLVNYASHPESLESSNTLLTSDYVHAVRRTLEQGSQWQQAPSKPGLGGPCLFVSGALGGMMTPLGVSVTNPDGNTFDSGFEHADSIGQLIGEVALDALAAGETIESPQLEFAVQPFYAEVINTQFNLAFMQGIFEREIYEMNGKRYVKTEMGVLELGPLRMLTVPGELLPELAVGGYDGSQMFTSLTDLVDPGNPNPPELADAPPGPYIKERMAAPYTWIVGLGNDELGYIIPAYDFELNLLLPYFNEAEGDHYEETNSLGPHLEQIVDDNTDFLIEFIEWL
jgi:hypothetical protein